MRTGPGALTPAPGRLGWRRRLLAPRRRYHRRSRPGRGPTSCLYRMLRFQPRRALTTSHRDRPEGAGSPVQLPHRRGLPSPQPPGTPPRHGRRRLRAVQTLRAPARVPPRWLCPFPFRDARRWVLKTAESRGAAWSSPRRRRTGDLAGCL